MEIQTKLHQCIETIIQVIKYVHIQSELTHERHVTRLSVMSIPRKNTMLNSPLENPT